MGSRQVARVHVIGDHTVELVVADDCLDENDWQPGRREVFDHCITDVPSGGYKEASNFLTGELPEQVVFRGLPSVDLQDHRVPKALGFLLYPVNDLGIEDIGKDRQGELLDQESEEAESTTAVPSLGNIAEALHGGENPIPRARGNPLAIIHDERYSRDRDACLAGDVGHTNSALAYM